MMHCIKLTEDLAVCAQHVESITIGVDKQTVIVCMASGGKYFLTSDAPNWNARAEANYLVRQMYANVIPNFDLEAV